MIKEINSKKNIIKQKRIYNNFKAVDYCFTEKQYVKLYPYLMNIKRLGNRPSVIVLNAFGTRFYHVSLFYFYS